MNLNCEYDDPVNDHETRKISMMNDNFAKNYDDMNYDHLVLKNDAYQMRLMVDHFSSPMISSNLILVVKTMENVKKIDVDNDDDGDGEIWNSFVRHFGTIFCTLLMRLVHSWIHYFSKEMFEMTQEKKVDDVSDPKNDYDVVI